MSTRKHYEVDPKRYGKNGVRAALFVGDESHIQVVGPAEEGSDWAMYVSSVHGGDVSLYIADLDTLRRLHDTIGAALADVDGDAS